MIAEPRRLDLRLRDGLWLRIVDVAAALEGRGYAADGRSCSRYATSSCPKSGGRFRLESVAGSARVSVDRRATRRRARRGRSGGRLPGCVQLRQLARAGRTRELHDGGHARADALFATSVSSLVAADLLTDGPPIAVDRDPSAGVVLVTACGRVPSTPSPSFSPAASQRSLRARRRPRSRPSPRRHRLRQVHHRSRRLPQRRRHCHFDDRASPTPTPRRTLRPTAHRRRHHRPPGDRGTHRHVPGRRRGIPGAVDRSRRHRDRSPAARGPAGAEHPEWPGRARQDRCQRGLELVDRPRLARVRRRHRSRSATGCRRTSRTGS